MKNTIRSMLLAASALMVVTACTDPTVAPKSSVSSANIFSEEASYKAFLAKIYAGLAVSGQQGPAGNGDISGLDEGFSQYMRLWWQMEELPTDEAAISWNDGPLQELNTQIWASSNSFPGLDVLPHLLPGGAGQRVPARDDRREAELARRVGGDDGRDQEYRAEARFLRAYSYWHAMDLFGPVPLVKETDEVARPRRRRRPAARCSTTSSASSPPSAATRRHPGQPSTAGSTRARWRCCSPRST